MRQDESQGDGLWKRKQHFADRSDCLNRFTRMFGGNPLRYTYSKFHFTTNGDLPHTRKHVSVGMHSCIHD